MGKAYLKNPRLTKKDRSLIIGGIKRIFSRSELRKRALDKALVKDYHDPSRKRVTRWFRCPECKEMIPVYLAEVDHQEPRIPLDRTADDMTLDEIVERTWCDERLLQPLCKPCHKAKTALETKIRTQNKRLKKETDEKT